MRPPRTPTISERERQSGMRRRWTSEEDEALRKYVADYGENNWRYVRNHLSRNRSTCIYRWKYVLRSTVTRNPLTDEEKARMRELYGIFGARWATIQSFTMGDVRFPVKRTEFDIKNYIEQVLLERAQDQDRNPDDVNDNDGNLQAPAEDTDQRNEEASSHGNQSSDRSLSVRVPPLVARNIDLNAPPPLDDDPD